MVAPVTSVVRIPVSSPTAYVDLRYDSQKPPYTLNLKMHNRYHRTTVLKGQGNLLPAENGPSFEMAFPDSHGLLTAANNKSYSKLIGKLGDASQLGATLTAERRESWNTVVTILTRVLQAAREVKRLNLFAAAQLLGLPYSERTRVETRVVVRRSRDGSRYFKVRHRIRRTYFDYGTGRQYLKTVANGWLMWSYGVKPLTEDIYNAMDILQRPFPWKRIEGKSTQKSSDKLIEMPSSKFLTIKLWSWKVSVKQSVDVRVANPNLWLLNRLGLVNPAQWALEGIPLSFVVDWFSNLSDVVNSLTDFVGLETLDPVWNCSGSVLEDHYFKNEYEPPDNVERHSVRSNEYRIRRLGIVLPKLRFAYERFQWQRGANAISLLLGMLPRK